MRVTDALPKRTPTLRKGGKALHDGVEVRVLGLDSDPEAAVLIVDPRDPDREVWVSRGRLVPL